MLEVGLGLVLANLLLLQLPLLPDLSPLLMALPVSLLGLRFRLGRTAGGFVLGLLLTWHAVEQELALRLPDAGGRAELEVVGRIIGLPVTTDGITRFRLRVTGGVLKGRNLRLTWYYPEQPLVPGDSWALPVRLMAPGGSLNFDLFDYERWLFLKRIHATGYVTEPLRAERLVRSSITVDRLRARLRDELSAEFSGTQIATLLALSLGDTSQLSRRMWDILNATGTTHLLIVSGLHTGLIATLAFFFAASAGH